MCPGKGSLHFSLLPMTEGEGLISAAHASASKSPGHVTWGKVVKWGQEGVGKWGPDGRELSIPQGRLCWVQPVEGLAGRRGWLLELGLPHTYHAAA